MPPWPPRSPLQHKQLTRSHALRNAIQEHEQARAAQKKQQAQWEAERASLERTVAELREADARIRDEQEAHAAGRALNAWDLRLRMGLCFPNVCSKLLPDIVP